MARDLIIHGINRIDFTNRLGKKFTDWSLPKEKLADFLKAFKYSIPVSKKILLEDYLYEQTYLTIAEQHQHLGIEEILAFRSKYICLAIAQLIAHYIDHLHPQFIKEGLIESNRGCFIMKKGEILSVLNWLIAVGNELNTEAKATSKTLPLEQAAKKLIQSSFCEGEEFNFYADHLPLFINWKLQIAKTKFDHYYWEDSY